jgi:hypothetical protein
MSGVGSASSYSWNLSSGLASTATIGCETSCGATERSGNRVQSGPYSGRHGGRHFENGDGAVGDVHLETNLVSGVFRKPAVGPPPDLIVRILWNP